MNRLKNTKKAKSFVFLFDRSMIYGTSMKLSCEMVEWTDWTTKDRWICFSFLQSFLLLPYVTTSLCSTSLLDEYFSLTFMKIMNHTKKVEVFLFLWPVLFFLVVGKWCFLVRLMNILHNTKKCQSFSSSLWWINYLWDIHEYFSQNSWMNWLKNA